MRSPDALLPRLDERHLAALHRVQRQWQGVSGDPETWRRALPVYPDFVSYPAPGQIRRSRLVRFLRVATLDVYWPAIQAALEAEVPSWPVRMPSHAERGTGSTRDTLARRARSVTNLLTLRPREGMQLRSSLALCRSG